MYFRHTHTHTPTYTHTHYAETHYAHTHKHTLTKRHSIPYIPTHPYTHIMHTHIMHTHTHTNIMHTHKTSRTLMIHPCSLSSTFTYTHNYIKPTIHFPTKTYPTHIITYAPHTYPKEKNPFHGCRVNKLFCQTVASPWDQSRASFSGTSTCSNL